MTQPEGREISLPTGHRRRDRSLPGATSLGEPSRGAPAPGGGGVPATCWAYSQLSAERPEPGSVSRSVALLHHHHHHHHHHHSFALPLFSPHSCHPGLAPAKRSACTSPLAAGSTFHGAKSHLAGRTQGLNQTPGPST